MNLEARVVYPPDKDAVEVYLRMDEGGKPVHGVADKGTILWKPHTPGGQMEPLLTMSGVMTGPQPFQILGAIADAVRRAQGEPDAGELRGKISALERHLEDMRALLWKEPRPR